MHLAWYFTNVEYACRSDASVLLSCEVALVFITVESLTHKFKLTFDFLVSAPVFF